MYPAETKNTLQWTSKDEIRNPLRSDDIWKSDKPKSAPIQFFDRIFGFQINLAVWTNSNLKNFNFVNTSSTPAQNECYNII